MKKLLIISASIILLSGCSNFDHKAGFDNLMREIANGNVLPAGSTYQKQKVTTLSGPAYNSCPVETQLGCFDSWEDYHDEAEQESEERDYKIEQIERRLNELDSKTDTIIINSIK